MKFVIETISGRKGIKHFADLNEYVDFMTNNGHKIKTIYESELPYSDKPVKLSKVSKSNGWEQIDNSAFGGIADKAEKGDCVLPKGNQGVFKNNASFEVSKSSESVKDEADDLPKFEYKDEDESKEEPKDEKKEKVTKSENKKEEKKINESLEDELDEVMASRGVELNEGVFEFFRNGVRAWTGTKDAKEKEIAELVNEYLVYVFMDVAKKVDYQHYEGIVKELIREDRKFAKVAERIRILVANELGGHTRTNVENLKGKLIKLGIDKEIVEKAYQTFMNEELNPKKEEQEEKQPELQSNEKQLDLFDEEIKEALRIAGIQLNEAEEKEINDYKRGYEDGKADWETGHPIPYEDRNTGTYSDYESEQYWRGYDDGYDDAKGNPYGDDEDEEDLEFEENVDNPDDGEIDEKSGKEKLFEDEPLEEAPMSDEEFDSLEDGDDVHWDLDDTHGNGKLSKGNKGRYKFTRDYDGGTMPNLSDDYIKGYFSKGHKEPMDEDSLEYAEKQLNAWKEEKRMAEYDDFAYTNGRMKDVEEKISYWTREVAKRSEKKSDTLHESEEEILDETKPARFNQHLGKDKSFANISASRSNDEFEKPGMEREKQLQSEDNNRKTEQLKKDIKDLGLSYIKTYGAWRDTGATTQEDSFLIPNITKEQALELGKKYGQYSVIFKDKGEDTAYMYITLDNEDFGKEDMAFDMSGDAKFNQVKKGKDELEPYSGYTGLKPGGKGYNLSYKVK